MTQFTVMFEDARWPDLPGREIRIRARDRSRAIDAAVPLFRRTFPLENLANYVAVCENYVAVREGDAALAKEPGA